MKVVAAVHRARTATHTHTHTCARARARARDLSVTLNAGKRYAQRDDDERGRVSRRTFSISLFDTLAIRATRSLDDALKTLSSFLRRRSVVRYAFVDYKHSRVSRASIVATVADEARVIATTGAAALHTARSAAGQHRVRPHCAMRLHLDSAILPESAELWTQASQRRTIDHG